MARRKRLMKSFKTELIRKSRESALAAVQTFNNPNITFKTEIYVILMVVSWTYLLHAYFRSIGVDYRYYDQGEKRKKFHRTKHGAYKHWELERCLNEKGCPLDKDTVTNLRFLIELRHEIEHQMTTKIDDCMSARFQATCLNYNDYVKKLFGAEYAIDKHLAFSLQFSSLSDDQVVQMRDNKELPAHIAQFIDGFDDGISEQTFNSPRFAYRVLFIAKTANHKGQADKVIEFVRADSPLAEKVNVQYTAIREVEKQKYRPGQIVKMMQMSGYLRFNMIHHTELWQGLRAKDVSKGYGTDKVAGAGTGTINGLMLLKSTVLIISNFTVDRRNGEIDVG